MTLPLDDALLAARTVEEYLYTLDRANALKNGQPTDVRLSPITEMAGEVSKALIALMEDTPATAAEEPALADFTQPMEEYPEFGDNGMVRVYYRPPVSGNPAHYEAALMDGGDIVESRRGDTPELALNALEVSIR